MHHGNGTQQAFYEDPDTLASPCTRTACSRERLRQPAERGEGRGEGLNINAPLPPGCGTGAYLAAFERLVIPALHAFRPEMIVVCSGFDAAG